MTNDDNVVKIDKIRVISSYLADKIDNLYVTKLMKLFYYIDFISYAERGSPITNDIYYKLPYGPVPSFIKSEIDNLKNPLEELGVKIKSQLSSNIKLEELANKDGEIIVNVAKRYDLRKMSEYEKKLVDLVIEKLGKKTSKFLTQKTHKEKPYLFTSRNSVIDYELANSLGGRTVLNK